MINSFWYFQRYFEINELIVLLVFLFLKLLKTYWKTSQLNSNFAFVCNAKRFAMAFAMYFFFLSLSPVFLDGVAIGFCLYFPRLLLKTSLTLYFLLGALKNPDSNILLIVICKTRGSRRAVCFSLFTVTSFHSAYKRTRNRKLRKEIEGDRSQVSKSRENE